MTDATPTPVGHPAAAAASRDPRLLVLFVAASLLATLPAFLHLSESVRRWFVLGLVVAFCWIGTREFRRVVAGRIQLRTYVLLQTAIALSLIFAAHGYGPVSVVLVPLATQIATLAPPRIGYLVAGLLTLGNGIPYALLDFGGTDVFVPMLLGYGTAIFAGTLFAYVLRRAEEARVRIEELERALAATQVDAQLRAQQEARLAIAEERLRTTRLALDAVGLGIVDVDERVAACESAASLGPDEARSAAAAARTTLRRLLADVTQASSALRGEAALRVPLATALSELADAARGGPAIEVAIAADAERMAPSTQFVLYRFAQEFVAAAHRNGAARRLHLRVDRDGDHARLEARTDDPRSMPAAAIASLRERVAVPGAGWEAVNATDGVRVVLRIPDQPSRNP